MRHGHNATVVAPTEARPVYRRRDNDHTVEIRCDIIKLLAVHVISTAHALCPTSTAAPAQAATLPLPLPPAAPPLPPWPPLLLPPASARKARQWRHKWASTCHSSVLAQAAVRGRVKGWQEAGSQGYGCGWPKVVRRWGPQGGD